MLER
jgi:hypothetical protein